MNETLAKNALALIDQVRGPYDDANINAVIQTKNMLRGIASGKLLVVPKLDPPAAESPQ